MEERLSIKDAAERLGVSVDTIRRRMKKGELVGEKEPTPQGYEWRIVLPVDESSATEPPEELVASPSLAGVAIELELLRERLDELKAERDAWREQAQRSSEAERELRILLRQSQELALPAKATRQGAPGAPEEMSPISEGAQSATGWLARLWSALRGSDR
jgi:excisionase family DNA binding protein